MIIVGMYAPHPQIVPENKFWKHRIIKNYKTMIVIMYGYHVWLSCMVKYILHGHVQW